MVSFVGDVVLGGGVENFVVVELVLDGVGVLVFFVDEVGCCYYLGLLVVLLGLEGVGEDVGCCVFLGFMEGYW